MGSIFSELFNNWVNAFEQEEGKKKPIYVISQDADSCVVYGMPKSIYEAGVVDEVVTLTDVAKTITKNVGVK